MGHEGSHLYLAENLNHLSRGKLHVLINSDTNKWVRVIDEAYQVIKWCEQMPISEVIRLAGDKFGADDGEITALFNLLLEKGIMQRDKPSSRDERVLGLSPINCDLCVTTRCNLRCITCCRDTRCSTENDPLSLVDLKMVLNKLSEAGCTNRIRITGGEPLLREEIFDILACARELSKELYFETNATLIDEVKAKKIAELVDVVNVGLDGCVPEIHEAIRGKGTFDKAVRGIRLLKEAGLKSIRISQTITSLNAHDIVNVSKLAQELGAEKFRGCSFMPVGRGRQSMESLIVRGDNGVFSIGDVRVIPGVITRCGALRHDIYVFQDGTVYGCEHLAEPRFAIGNLLNSEDINDILSRAVITQKELLRTVDEIPICGDCDVRYFCGGGCSALRYNYGGRLDAPYPLCYIYKEGYGALLWE